MPSVDGTAICCQCGEPIRGTICHDADRCHTLHFTCDGRSLAHCSCAGYPLSPSPCKRRALGDITKSVNNKSPPLWLHRRLSLHDIEEDQRSPASMSTRKASNSASPSSISSLDFGDELVASGMLEIDVLALSGERLCSLSMPTTWYVIALKIKIHTILGIPAPQQKLVCGEQCLLDFELLSTWAPKDDSEIACNVLTVNLVSAPAPAPPSRRPATDGQTNDLADIVEIMIKSTSDLPQRSLFLSMRYIDSYLSQRRVSKSSLPQIAASALIMADERDSLASPFGDREYVRALRFPNRGRGRGGFSMQELNDSQHDMMSALEHSKSATECFLPCDYLESMQKTFDGSFSQDHKRLMSYLLEHSLLRDHLRKYDPCLLAASVILSSNRTMGWDSPWPATLANMLPYPEELMKQCSDSLNRVVNHCSSPGSMYQALQQKYADVLHRFRSTTMRAYMAGA